MIPYEDLCAALEAYAARTRGVSPTSADETMHGRYGGAPVGDPPTSEVSLPPDEMPGLHSHGGDDATHVGQLGEDPAPLDPVYDVASSELDLGDAMSDDDSSN